MSRVSEPSIRRLLLPLTLTLTLTSTKEDGAGWAAQRTGRLLVVGGLEAAGATGRPSASTPVATRPPGILSLLLGVDDCGCDRVRPHVDRGSAHVEDSVDGEDQRHRARRQSDRVENDDHHHHSSVRNSRRANAGE